jgi:hypothetical protein
MSQFAWLSNWAVAGAFLPVDVTHYALAQSMRQEWLPNWRPA